MSLTQKAFVERWEKASVAERIAIIRMQNERVKAGEKLTPEMQACYSQFNAQWEERAKKAIAQDAFFNRHAGALVVCGIIAFVAVVWGAVFVVDLLPRSLRVVLFFVYAGFILYWIVKSAVAAAIREGKS